jgi:hypothetical protein
MRTLVRRPLALIVAAAAATLLSAAAPAPCRAEVALGGHFGLNLDAWHPMIGADVRVDVIDISDRVRLDLWGAYSHVFIRHHEYDVDLIEFDAPFLFRVNTDVVTPYAAPGFGLSFSNGTTLKLNLIGGCLFHVSERLEPFAQLAIRMINGTYVDLIGGLLVRL